jgi:hypothetical protein
LEEPQTSYQGKHTRDKLESCIGDYNTIYDTSYSTKDSNSFQNISKRLKDREKENFGNEKGHTQRLHQCRLYPEIVAQLKGVKTPIFRQQTQYSANQNSWRSYHCQNEGVCGGFC